jgi:endonuclease/exonuclease/phosphatase family metal-dependent hydrolase
MSQVSRFRIVTYNVHKCVGVDRRLDPARIVSVLKEINADVVALQEVLCIHGGASEDDQAHFIASGLGFNYYMGHNRELKGGVYGNLVLSRFPLLGSENHDISVAGREERGCLRVDVALGKESRLHVYNVHLGTSFIERRRQARKLISESILSDGKRPGPRIMLGDFNEWTRGLVTRLLNEHFQTGDICQYPPISALCPLDLYRPQGRNKGFQEKINVGNLTWVEDRKRGANQWHAHTEAPDWRSQDRRSGRLQAPAANLLKPRYSSACQTGLSACSRVQYLVCALFAQPQKRP